MTDQTDFSDPRWNPAQLALDDVGDDRDEEET